MSDRSAMSIQIGGKLAEAHVAKFVDLIQQYALTIDDYGGRACGEAQVRRAWAGSLNLYHNEISDGVCEDLEAFCRKVGLAYVRGDDGHYAYAAMIDFWEPGMGEAKTWPTNDERLPLLDQGTIRALRASGDLDAELELMKQAETFNRKFSVHDFPIEEQPGR